MSVTAIINLIKIGKKKWKGRRGGGAIQELTLFVLKNDRMIKQ